DWDARAAARAERLVARWGGPAVLMTRFLLTPLAPVVNLAAGAGHYPFRRFALYDVVGEAIWVGAYVGLGYAFSANLDRVARLLGSATTAFSLLAILAVLLALLAYAYAAKLRHDRATADAPTAPELRSDA
ncbi:MAG: VTT domain-containing protein, partial [Chloroflexota bacterium]|nr:VTT domain-containing protein [Chloroflexota bacterium]